MLFKASCHKDMLLHAVMGHSDVNWNCGIGPCALFFSASNAGFLLGHESHGYACASALSPLDSIPSSCLQSPSQLAGLALSCNGVHIKAGNKLIIGASLQE